MPSVLSAELWNSSNTVKVGDLTDSLDRRFQDPISQVGSGSLRILNDHPLAGQCRPGRHIRTLVNGEAAYSWRIARRERASISKDEEAGEITALSGPGHVEEWGHAIVYPRGGVEARPTSDTRPFFWATPAPEYSPEGWAPAVVQQPDAFFRMGWAEWTVWPPAGWPAPVASPAVSWIYSRAYSYLHPPGKTYYRRNFTLAQPTALCVFATGDDRIRVFLDGVALIDWTSSYPVWSLNDTYRCTLPVSAGTHTIAIECENFDFSQHPVYRDLRPDGSSPAAVLCAVHVQPSSTFSASTLLFGSDASWQCLDYPAVPPAPTPGQVLGVLASEAQARGALTGWSFGGSFSSGTDSNGVPWATVREVAPKVGDSLLQVLDSLASDAIDYHAAPSSKTLWVWNKGEARAVGPSFSKGVDIVELVHVEEER